MARGLYKTIAAVLFVLVTIQYFYFYPLKNGVQTASSIPPGALLSSVSSSGIQSNGDSHTVTAPSSPSPTYLWRRPKENSNFYIVNHFSPPPPLEDEDPLDSSMLTPPAQEPQLINLLNQANSRLNQSLNSSHLATRLNPYEKSERSLEKVSFVSSDNNESRDSHISLLVLVSNFTMISENQSIITLSPLNSSSSTVELDSSPSVTTTLSSATTTLSPFGNGSALPMCPSLSPLLVGFARVKLQSPSLADIGRQNNDLELGGHFRPPNCRARSRVAIIVPFRDREDHLRLFLYNLIPMLKRQQVEFNIFVIEQGGSSKNEPFNRAMLFNVGFVEANKRYPYWQCFIFHDVDLIPENDYNLYDCPVQPRHMSVAVDKMKYRLPYKTIFGGISSLTKEHFIRVNGFSNMFWGWGAEDDDMAGRIAFHGLFISRPSPSVARYRMLKHRQQKLNKQRYKVLQKGKHRFNSDGLSNLNYTVEQIILEKTHTLIRVQLFRVGEAG